MGRDSSLPPTPQSPAVAASHRLDQQRPAEGRQRRPREAGMAAGDGGAADLSGKAGRETWKTLGGPRSNRQARDGWGRRGRGKGWRSGGRRPGWASRGGGEATFGEGRGAPLATVAAKQAFWGALRGVWVSKGTCADSAWLLGVALPEGEERDFGRPGVVQCLTLRGAWKGEKGGEWRLWE